MAEREAPRRVEEKLNYVGLTPSVHSLTQESYFKLILMLNRATVSCHWYRNSSRPDLGLAELLQVSSM